MEKNQQDSDPDDSIPVNMGPLATLDLRVETQWVPEDTRTPLWTPPPWFMEIAQSLWGANPPHVETLPELARVQSPLVGAVTAMLISMRLLQVGMTDITYVDMITASMSLVGLGANPMVDDYPMPTLERWEDSESN